MVEEVNIKLAENGWCIQAFYKDSLEEKFFVAKEFEDIANLFIKWGFTPLHQSKKNLLNELNNEVLRGNNYKC